jgi:molybdopterin-guanine dinucleotide biosynthesis protein A
MGRDKAALPFGDTTLLEHVVAQLHATQQNPPLDVTLIGAPERYGHLGLRAVADRYQNCGPLGGVCTALETTSADFNFIVACDMPGVTTEFFRSLIAAAEAPGSYLYDADCVIPETADGLHPLCAVYHRRVLPLAQQRILGQSLKMHDFVASLRVVKFPVAAAFVENVNAPVDWQSRVGSPPLDPV